MDEETVELVKGDEDIVTITLGRPKRPLPMDIVPHCGVVVTVKAHPIVEDFMRSLGDGRTMPPEAYQKGWYELRDVGPFPSLAVYNLDQSSSDPQIEGNNYTINQVGRPLEFFNEMSGNKQVNLSFLRLAGISDGAGVRFGIKGTYNTDTLREIKMRITNAVRNLWLDYIRPLDMTVSITSQEISLIPPRPRA